MDVPDGEVPMPHPPKSAEAQHRLLAAVVFTDAVSFSKLAGRDEQAAFRILNRDFSVMTSICGAHGGRVLNTMGDGMLMVFPSAVEAMQCALKIQQSLYAQSKTLPAVSVLQHRLGVHLGDIIIDGENVFGDGVNVAARLQSECKPGAICYSRMVGDVIRNKVAVKARFLGAKHLKNIVEPVPVYEVPPLSEYDTDYDPIDTPEVIQPDQGASGSKAAWLLVASVALIALAVFAVLKLTRPNNDLEKKLAMGNGKPTPTTTATTPTSTPTPTSSPTGMGVDLDRLRSLYDFKGLIRACEADPGKAAMLDKYRAMDSLRSWLESELAGATQSRSLAVTLGGQAGRLYQGTRGLTFESPGGIREIDLSQLSPADWLNLVDTVKATPVSGQPAPSDLPRWIQAFKTEYGA